MKLKFLFSTVLFAVVVLITLVGHKEIPETIKQEKVSYESFPYDNSSQSSEVGEDPETIRRFMENHNIEFEG